MQKTGILRCPFFVIALQSEANQFAVFQDAFLRVVKHLRAVREGDAFVFVERRHQGFQDAFAADEARQRQADVVKGAATGGGIDGVAVVDDGVRQAVHRDADAVVGGVFAGDDGERSVAHVVGDGVHDFVVPGDFALAHEGGDRHAGN